MTDMEILILIAETHGDNLTAMLSAPRIDMGVLQQVVAHLTLISGKYHMLTLFVISKYFFITSSETSFSRFLSQN